MGACASRPNDNELKDEDAPIEAPTPKKAEVEAVTQEENKEGGGMKDEPLVEENKEGDEKKDEPLIDLDEPKEEKKKTEEPSEPAAPPTETEAPAQQPSEAPVSKDKSDD